MTGPAGARCRLHYDVDGARPADCGDAPAAGDMVATPAGSCYLIVSARPGGRRPGRFYLEVERLQRGACRIGEPGVWPLFWYARRRAAA